MFVRSDGHDPPVACDGRSGYISEGFNGSSSLQEKKGLPWTEHEHNMFLLGLRNLGRDDLRGISRNYVISRTPIQVASHAQKFFFPHRATERRKRRTTLADMKKDFVTTEMETSLLVPPATMNYSYLPPVYPTIFFDDNAKISGNIEVELQAHVTMQCCYPPAYPGFFSGDFHFPIPCRNGYAESTAVFQSHEIVKPMAVYSKSPINVDELFGMSTLNLEACNEEVVPLVLGPKHMGSL